MLSHIWHNFKQIDYKYHIICALCMHIIVIQYGQYHDETYAVPFTDVDYKVFTDAARYVLNRTSPYNRHTYRYTPLIAILLTPNLFLHNSFGKYLFSFVNILVALLIRVIVKNSLKEYEIYKHKQDGTGSQNEIKHLKLPRQLLTKKRHKKYKWTDTRKTEMDVNVDLSMLIWLYNPMSVAIATRGNCDSVAGLFVLIALYFLQCKHRPFWAGIFHGIAIHLRLYPLMYSLAYFMYLSKFSFYSSSYHKEELKETLKKIENTDTKQKKNVNPKKVQTSLKKLNHKGMKEVKTGKEIALTSEKNERERRTIFKKEYLFYLVPNLEQIQLITGCLLALTSLTGIFYLLYGYQFLYESYIYHIIRKDTRHNFSLYFYLQYLTAGIKIIGLWQRMLILLPQLILLVVFAIRYGLNKLALNFAVLSQTIVMVSYNTVLTSQYFIWILSVLPLCLWQIRLSKMTALFLITIWSISQAAWLLPAYLLEFHGENMFMYIWIQSVAFFSANMAILGRLVRNFMTVKSGHKIL